MDFVDFEDFVGRRTPAFFTVEDGSAGLRVRSGALTSSNCVALAGGVLDSDARFRPRTCAAPLVELVTLSVLMLTSSI
jgi:hypothetical protein